MAHNEPAEWIVPTEGAKTLPAIEILTGRGFITGKSGSGKSNSASVIAEKLLDNNYNLMIVDPEGEYYGLKEKYELLHVGADDICDVQVKPSHSEKLAEIALERNIPIILDVSDFLDGDEAKDIIANVVEDLYHKEKEARKPFLLMIEEMQEYLPQSGGRDELAELLERVAKRGRKRGLGMLGMSQRPSSVDKDFITQCDWMVWHRLTWKNDIDVVRNILGSSKADDIEDFETGEGFLMTDWDDCVERVKFKRKRTHDAGATPGLESYERPDLKSVGTQLIAEIESGDQPIDHSDHSGPDTDAPESNLDVDEATANISDVEEDQLDGDSFDTTATTQNDLDDLSADELRAKVEELRRRNLVLEDEIRELRTILKESGSSASTTGIPASTSQARSKHAAEPSRPQPPRRPPDRHGLAGNLVEFTEMLVYLYKSAKYRFELLAYRIQASEPQDEKGPG